MGCETGINDVFHQLPKGIQTTRRAIAVTKLHTSHMPSIGLHSFFSLPFIRITTQSLSSQLKHR